MKKQIGLVLLALAVMAPGPVPTCPQAPSNLTATATSPSTIHLTWVAASADYQVLFESIGAGSTSFSDVARPRGSTYDATFLTPSNTYNFKLNACNKKGSATCCSAYSNVATATTPGGVNTPTPTSTSVAPTPTRTPTPLPPTPTRTPTPLSSPTPTPTPAAPTATPAIFFEPLQPDETVSCGTGVNWYGSCKTFLKVFGQATGSFKENSWGLPGPTKFYHSGGVAIDRSMTPNRLYIYDRHNNRIMGWSSLGLCSAGGSQCTNDLDCVGGGGVCNINADWPADLVLGQNDLQHGACNQDFNVGFHAMPGSSPSGLCFWNSPDNGNPAESFGGGGITVDAFGSLYVTDQYNERVLRFDDPFGAGGADADPKKADWMWGQVPYTNQAGPPTPHSMSLGSGPGRQRGGISVDSSRTLWFADTGHMRVLRIPFGATDADLVIGQPDMYTWISRRCYGNSSPPVEQPLNALCFPIRAEINPATGELWVLDGENNDVGNGTPGQTARFVVFAPPFNNGMKAARVFRPNLPIPSGCSFRGDFGNSFTFNTYTEPPYDQGVVWMNEQGEGCAYEQTFLLDANGDYVRHVGPSMNLESESLPGICGSTQADGWGIIPIGQLAQDAAHNLYGVTGYPNFLDIWKMPADPYCWNGIAKSTPTAQPFPTPATCEANYTLCPPKPTRFTSALAEGNPMSLATMGGAQRSFATGNQLAVADGRQNGTLVWNNYTTKASGAPADFKISAGFGSKDERGNRVAVDDANHVWIVHPADGALPAGLHAYSLPLTATPIALGSGALYWADDPNGAPIAWGADSQHPEHGQRFGLSQVAFDALHDHLYVADVGNNRIFRISNYREVDVPGAHLLVDRVIGQPDKISTLCNRGSTGTCNLSPSTPCTKDTDCCPAGNCAGSDGECFNPPTSQTLCSGGRLDVDSLGNLWVLDTTNMHLDLSCGNARILGYLTADLEAGDGIFTNVAAAKVINDSGSMTVRGACSALWQGNSIAIDGSDRLLETSNFLHGKSPYGYWQLGVYATPLTKQTADYYVRIPLGWTPGISVDRANGNVVLPSLARTVVVNTTIDPSWLSPMPGLVFMVGDYGTSIAVVVGGISQSYLFTPTNLVGPFSPISYAVTGVPPNVTAAFSPASCNSAPCATASLILQATAQATPGAYKLVLSVTSAEGYQVKRDLTLYVNASALSCNLAPGYAPIHVNDEVVFFALGGYGSGDFDGFTIWTGGESPVCAGAGPLCNGRRWINKFYSAGTKSLTVARGAQTATCLVNVVP